jgi:hypothetical protein
VDMTCVTHASFRSGQQSGMGKGFNSEMFRPSSVLSFSFIEMF